MRYNGAAHRIEVLEQITFNNKVLQAGRYLRVASGYDVLAEYGDKVRAVDWHTREPVVIEGAVAFVDVVRGLMDTVTDGETNKSELITHDDLAEVTEEVTDFSDNLK